MNTTTAAPGGTDALYAAEDRAATAAGVRRYRRFTELSAHVAAVVTSDWWDQRFPDAPAAVHVERRSRNATYSAAVHHPALGDAAVIAIIDGRHWSTHVVLHELAHVATRGDGHGPEFRSALIALWRREAGIYAAATLVAELRAAGFPVDLNE